MKNKSKLNIILLVILIILLVVVLGYFFLRDSKEKENNNLVNEKLTGAYCINLIDEPDKCYQKNEVTCEQKCIKGMWTEFEGKITNPNFTKWKFTTEECKRDDGIVHDAGWGYKDSPTPTTNCCCDY
ncbi:MAG: hypothetical protein WCO07_03180 [bacterium]